jgi:hypothetical protein
MAKTIHLISWMVSTCVYVYEFERGYISTVPPQSLTKFSGGVTALLLFELQIFIERSIHTYTLYKSEDELGLYPYLHII